ncbi:MAG: tRNA (adenosine(37)-N6)-dimethylallyltransferase MiaA [Tissierellia bacterium]|nr:tRNA (adenosine(37)-N6)-dimethylallyltransferase MiaA [Tissierellia bacterium]
MTISNRIIIITGPTGVGKSSLSVELAKVLDTEIISADSMQIYKYMDIGTAKIKEEEMQGVKHHMLDIVYPDQEYSVDDYKKDCYDIINRLNEDNKIPIITGGTGLYLDSLIYDLNFNIAPPNEFLRAYYKEIANKYGNEYLHSILEKVDPTTAKKNHPNQVKRIIRALEVFDQTSKPFSYFNDYSRKYLNIDFKYIVLNRDRDEIYELINERVEKMIAEGLIEEVKKLLEMGYDKNLNSMKAIGYKECIDYIDGKYNYNDMIEKLKQNSRRYAKRQLTWFRREPSRRVIEIEKDDDISKILNNCLDIIGD